MIGGNYLYMYNQVYVSPFGTPEAECPQILEDFVLECYKLTATFPADERFGMVAQIRRAALSVYLNIAEGASRRSAIERKRFFEIARGSVIEVDSALGIAAELDYTKGYNIEDLKNATITCFKILSGLIKSD